MPPRARSVLLSRLLLAVVAHIVQAPKSWTWRGGERMATGEAGIFGVCSNWEQEAWNECLLHTSTALCESELGLTNCDGFTGTVWPGARYGHDMSRDLGTDDAWLFGGVGHAAEDAGRLNDLWHLPTMPDGVQVGQWRWVGGSTSSNAPAHHGVRGAASLAAWPGARSDHKMVVDGSGSIWLFGGQGYSSQGAPLGLLNDLWEFQAGLWRWVGGAPGPDATGSYKAPHEDPCAQLGETAALQSCGAACVPAGACRVSGFDGGTARWPGARSQHAMWRDNAQKLWVFGGSGFGASAGAVGFLNDLWEYSAGDLCRCTSCVCASSFWLHISQRAACNFCAGLWSLRGGDAELGTPAVGPGLHGQAQMVGARRSSAVYYDKTSGALYLYGGEGVGGSLGSNGLLNDLWVFDALGNWSFLSGSLSADEHSSFGAFATCLPTDPLALWPDPGQPCTSTDLSDGGVLCGMINGCSFAAASYGMPGSRKEHVMWVDRAEQACDNTPGWITYVIDSTTGGVIGSNTCVNYEMNEAQGVCAQYGYLADNSGVTASQACCVCGGGSVPPTVVRIGVFGGLGQSPPAAPPSPVA